MHAKDVRPGSKAIQERFFQALYLLIDGGQIKSLRAFCEDYDLFRPRYATVKNNIGDISGKYKNIDIDALAILARDYNVSPDWLLLGVGGMFRISTSK